MTRCHYHKCGAELKKINNKTKYCSYKCRQSSNMWKQMHGRRLVHDIIEGEDPYKLAKEILDLREKERIKP